MMRGFSGFFFFKNPSKLKNFLVRGRDKSPNPLATLLETQQIKTNYSKIILFVYKFSRCTGAWVGCLSVFDFRWSILQKSGTVPLKSAQMESLCMGHSLSILLFASII